MSVAEKMTAIADAIREKTGETGKLSLDGMAEALRKLPGPIVATAVGNPIALSDATDLKLRGLKLFGKTTQNGTPTPESPIPLVSAGDGGSVGVTVAGKNFWKFGEELTFTTYKSTMPVFLPAGQWTLSGIITNDYAEADTCRFVIYDVDQNNIGTLQIPKSADGERKQRGFTVVKDIHYITVYAADQYRSGYTATWKHMQIERGLTATEYEPYKSQTLPVSTPDVLSGIPVTSGGNYTDETGQQWICDEVDFSRGVYVQRVYKNTFTDFSKSISYYTNQVVTEAAVYAGTRVPSSGVYGGSMCSHFKRANSGNEPRFAVNAEGVVWFVLAGEMTHDEWRAKMAELSPTVCFPMEASTETALSVEELAAYAALHTNYPNTTILNDGGAGMEAKYVADTKLYIDNKINAMAAAIVNA